MRLRAKAPTTVRARRGGTGTDDDKGSDYALSGSEEDGDDDDDEVEVSDYEDDDGDEVAEAKKATAKPPARAPRARNAAAGACARQRGSCLAAASFLTPHAAQARKAARRRRLQKRRRGARRLLLRGGGGIWARRSCPTTMTTWRMSWTTCLRVRRAVRDRARREAATLAALTLCDTGFSSFASDFGGYDFSHLILKPDHANRCACSLSSAALRSRHKADNAWQTLQPAVAVPRRPHLPGVLLAHLQGSLRLPNRSRGAGARPAAAHMRCKVTR